MEIIIVLDSCTKIDVFKLLSSSTGGRYTYVVFRLETAFIALVLLASISPH